jgi:hypothetical protein
MTTKPAYETEKLKTNKGQEVLVHFYVVKNFLTPITYLVSWEEYPPSIMRDFLDKNILRRVVLRNLENSKGKLLNSEEFHFKNLYPSRKIKIKTPQNNILQGYIIFVKKRKRLYQVLVKKPRTQEKRQEIQKFLNSFSLLEQGQ